MKLILIVILENIKVLLYENDPLLLGIVNSANIACGYHAGDEPTMKKTVKFQKKWSKHWSPSFF